MRPPGCAGGRHGTAARGALARWLVHSNRIAGIVLFATPLVAILVRSPGLLAGQLVLGLGVMALGVVVHLVTLPVELDASFRRALPVLGQGCLAPADLPRARRVLRAAALTYLAGALVSLVNVARWIRMLRRAGRRAARGGTLPAPCRPLGGAPP